MYGISYKCFVLVFRGKELLWKGNVKVEADDAAGAVNAAVKQMKTKYADSYVHVPGKNNPRVAS